MHAYTFKYIVIGNSGVGKSSIVLRLTDNRFLAMHDLTIGVDFGVKTVRVKDKDIKLQIWDSAGQEAFRSITRSYYRGVAGVLLVYDITSRQSFNQIPIWLEEIRKENPHHQPVIMLIGNKSDMASSRYVSEQEGRDFAQLHGLLFSEVSAKTETPNQSVNQVFSQIAEQIYDNLLSGQIKANDTTGIKQHDYTINRPSTEVDLQTSKGYFSCCFQ